MLFSSCIVFEIGQSSDNLFLIIPELQKKVNTRKEKNIKIEVFKGRCNTFFQAGDVISERRIQEDETGKTFEKYYSYTILTLIFGAGWNSLPAVRVREPGNVISRADPVKFRSRQSESG